MTMYKYPRFDNLGKIGNKILTDTMVKRVNAPES